MVGRRKGTRKGKRTSQSKREPLDEGKWTAISSAGDGVAVGHLVETLRYLTDTGDDAGGTLYDLKVQSQGETAPP